MNEEFKNGFEKTASTRSQHEKELFEYNKKHTRFSKQAPRHMGMLGTAGAITGGLYGLARGKSPLKSAAIGAAIGGGSGAAIAGGGHYYWGKEKERKNNMSHIKDSVLAKTVKAIRKRNAGDEEAVNRMTIEHYKNK